MKSQKSFCPLKIKSFCPFISRLLLTLFAFAALTDISFVYSEDSKPEPKPDQKSESPQRKPSNVMSFFGGGAWLERSEREDEERPDDVIKAMELKETDVVADVGCGTGYFTRRIAKLIPKGKIYAVDIQPPMIEEVKKTMQKENLTNIVPIVNEPEDPKLPKGQVDWILLVDVYHEFQNPKPMLAKMLESLSPNGRVALVEYRGEGDTAKHIRAEHRMSIKQVLAEWNPAGFELVDLIETLPSQHIFIFHKRPTDAERK